MSISRGLSPVILLFLIAATAIAPATVEADGSRTSIARPSPPDRPTGPGGLSEQPSIIAFKAGRLNVRVENRSLEWTLASISRQSGVPIISTGDLGSQLVTTRLENLSLDDALRQLLKGHDVFFFYGAEEKKPAALKAVWVYPGGQGRGLMPVAPDAWASSAELVGDLADPEPAVRARAVEALVERKGQQSLQPVLQALSDPEEEVRYRALNSAIQSALDLPRDFLWGLLAYDPSPAVRFLVLTAMTGPLDTLNAKDPSAVRSIAEFALTDSDPNVSLQAEQILANLETASQAQDTIEPIQGEEGATYGVENE